MERIDVTDHAVSRARERVPNLANEPAGAVRSALLQMLAVGVPYGRSFGPRKRTVLCGDTALVVKGRAIVTVLTRAMAEEENAPAGACLFGRRRR